MFSSIDINSLEVVGDIHILDSMHVHEWFDFMGFGVVYKVIHIEFVITVDVNLWPWLGFQVIFQDLHVWWGEENLG